MKFRPFDKKIDMRFQIFKGIIHGIKKIILIL